MIPLFSNSSELEVCPCVGKFHNINPYNIIFSIHLMDRKSPSDTIKDFPQIFAQSRKLATSSPDQDFGIISREDIKKF